MKKALITGITGQDGAYLAEFLVQKGYEVHGIKRRASLFNTDRIDHLYRDPHEPDRRLILHHGDLTDSSNLMRILQQVQPDELYNLAAQSHVAVSFEEPEYTANSDALGTLRLLEAIRILGLGEKTRFYQASTSELFGRVRESPQRETTPFYPRSPYAVAKLYAYWITVNYREAYGLYACNGILFNHECLSGQTPLLIRKGRRMDVAAVRDLIALREDGPDVQHVQVPDLAVWDGVRWARVGGITATRRDRKNPDHRLIAIETDAGAVTVTAHHRMLDPGENHRRADTLAVGMRLRLAEAWPRPTGWTVLHEALGEFLGMMTAAGSVSDDGQPVVRFMHSDPALGSRVAELWERLFLGEVQNAPGMPDASENPGAALYLRGADAAVRWLRESLYDSRGDRKVPALLLNATPEVQAAYLDGYHWCQGSEAGIQTRSPLLAQGFCWLYANQGKGVSLDRRCDDEGGDFFRVRVRDPSRDPSQRSDEDPAEIRRLDPLTDPSEAWVFDLETDTGHLMAGPGSLVVHNSPIRGETFVTRKITRALARIKLGLQDCLYLGNLDAKRDWGHARDYVRMQWLMLQQPEPEDFVIATGEQHSVREFVIQAADALDLAIRWEGEGLAERGIDPESGRVLVAVDPRYFRPTEVETLLGDATKARKKLGWVPRIGFRALVREMALADLREAERDQLCQRAGFPILQRRE